LKGVRGLAARAGVKLVETTVKQMDQNLVKITGATKPSGIPHKEENSPIIKKNYRKHSKTKNRKKKYKR
jgi:predicted metalloprotease with PDZ domain